MPHGALVEQLVERGDIAGVERVVSALHDRYVLIWSHVSLLVVISTGTAVTQPVSPRAISPADSPEITNPIDSGTRVRAAWQASLIAAGDFFVAVAMADRLSALLTEMSPGKREELGAH